MGVYGYGTGGASGTAPSEMFLSLPWKGWREAAQWVEEFVDAAGYRFDVLKARFISASARANLLDPSYTPVETASQYLAIATSPPTGAASRDSMLDILLFIALGVYPVDSNLSTAQRQALAAAGWDSKVRKGTPLRMLNIASLIAESVAKGWTSSVSNFSVIFPDGAPSPGWGNWVQASSSISEAIRPWVLGAYRQLVPEPAFTFIGAGFSQARAGYSAAGESTFAIGTRICILAGEHFSTWTAGVPDNWTKSGTGTLTQSTTSTYTNWEFTANAAVFDLTAAPLTTSVGLNQTAANINNQLVHRLQVDYQYTNSQNVSVLGLQVTDANPNGTTYYWNGTAWQSTAYTIAMPPSSTRTRYTLSVTPQAASASTSVAGTQQINVSVFATSDGTATTKVLYTIYRVGLFEQFNLATESQAFGERTAWYPLRDAAGWTSAVRSSGVTLIEPANAQRSAYKAVTNTTAPMFPYHPALGGRGFASFTSWTNILGGSNSFGGSDWSKTNCSVSSNTIISPLVGETSPTAPTITASSTGARVDQGTGVTPTNKTYCGGVWVKKLSTDGNYTDVTVSLISNSTKSQAFTVTQAEGWKLLPFNFAFGGGDATALSMRIAWGAASSNGQISLASAYLYDVTGKTGVLYPPVVQTAAGVTGSTGATTCKAVSSVTDTSVLHPLLLRVLGSVVRSSMALTIVPTFDAASQPDGVIFDLAEGATTNRVVLRVASGALELKRWDTGGNTWTTSLTLSKLLSPGSSQVTWLRDAPIVIRCIWDDNSTQLSAGNSNASGAKPGSWAPSDAAVSKFRIGVDRAGSNQFDGIIRDFEVDQLGALL